MRPRNAGHLRARTVALVLSAWPQVSQAITREVRLGCDTEAVVEAEFAPVRVAVALCYNIQSCKSQIYFATPPPAAPAL